MTATYVNVVPGEKLLVEVETATPGTFAAPALINAARGLDLMANLQATDIPRTDDPSQPAQVGRGATNTDWKVTGAGVLNLGDDLTYATWLTTAATKNVRVSVVGTGGLVLVGPAMLSAFSVTGDRGKKIEANLTIEGAGVFTITAHA